MEKIDINQIRGEYIEDDWEGKIIGGGDDTIDSIKLVAEKVNEIIDFLEINNK